MGRNPGKPGGRSRLSFRALLLLTLLGVLLATVGVVGVVSYLNARFIVDDLSAHILDQTAERIHDRIRTLLDGAALLSDVHLKSLAGRDLTAADFPRILPHFHESMELARKLSYISLGLETGAYCHVYRRPTDGELEIRTREIQADGRTLRIDWRLDGDDDLIEVTRDFDDYDPRPRPYYRHAKQVGRQTWPDVYLFRNDPNPDYPGLTCATPVYGPESRFQGVMTADFDLLALGRFLKTLRIFESGRAFVVESRRDGQRRVVAHPDPDVLTGEVEIDGETKVDILPVERIESAPIRAFMAEIPTALPARGDAAPPLMRLSFRADGVRYVGAYLPLRSRHDLNCLVGIVVPTSDLMGPVESSNRQTLLIGIASLLAAAIVAITLARRFSHPLTLLARESVSIGRLQLEAGPATDSSVAELALLSEAMEEMKAGLRSFQKFVPAELVRNVLSSGRDVALGGERRVLTIAFTDIAGFTESAETMSPEVLVQLLGEYFEAVSEEVTAAEGTVDKYIGDAVMAFWGAPIDDESHATHACRAAWHAQTRLASLRSRWKERGRPAWRARTGIATGETLVGNIGSASRFNYSVIGDTVNLASRMEGLNKFYGTSILISGATFRAARAAVVARPLERVAVKGRRQGTVIYELLGLAGEVSEETLRLAEHSRRALARYLRRDFTAAAAAFREVLALRPDDRAATVLAESAKAHAKSPPPPDWDGIRRMEQK